MAFKYFHTGNFNMPALAMVMQQVSTCTVALPLIILHLINETTHKIQCFDELHCNFNIIAKLIITCPKVFILSLWEASPHPFGLLPGLTQFIPQLIDHVRPKVSWHIIR